MHFFRRKRKYYTFTPYTTDFLETVHGAKLLEFENKETIVLVDGMSYEEGLKVGYPVSFIDYFRFGFPPTWEFIISKFYLSRQRCITNSEMPRAIKGILKSNSTMSNETKGKKRSKNKDVNNDCSVLREQNKENDKNSYFSNSKDTSSNDTKSVSQMESPQKHSETFSMSLRSRSRKNQFQGNFKKMDECQQNTKVNNRSRGKSLEKLTKKDKISVPSRRNETQQQKGRSQSLKIPENAEYSPNFSGKKHLVQEKHLQLKKVLQQKETLLLSDNKKIEQPLKSCLKKNSSSIAQKKDTTSTKPSLYTQQQHTFFKNKLLKEKMFPINKQSVTSKRLSEYHEDSPKTKNPRQASLNEYNFSFLPRRNVEPKSSEAYLNVVLKKNIRLL